MKFNEKIIQARKAKALTQEDLAEAVGVSRQAVSKWETGEANPDLDKLVSICKVLDLSMDYLCLDKQPQVPAEVSQTEKPNHIRYLITGLCIGLVAALLIGLLVMALTAKKQDDGQSQNQPTGTVTTAPTTTTAPDYSHMLGNLQVADANCKRFDGHTWRISFVPSVEVPGMQVKMAVLNKKLGTTYYQDVTKHGSSYVLDYTVPDYAFDMDILVVCTVGEVSVQFSLINLESTDGVGVHWYHLWKD